MNILLAADGVGLRAIPTFRGEEGTTPRRNLHPGPWAAKGILMKWANWIMRRVFSGSMEPQARQLAALCEEPAWTLVESRAMWMNSNEFRGYLKARTRLLIDRNLADAERLHGPFVAPRELRHRIQELLTLRLGDRAVMAQSRVESRRAA